MKKIILPLFSFLLVFSIYLMAAPKTYAVSATFAQSHFRFRNDDGSESAATWKAAEDTNITGLAKSANFRLRIQTRNSSVNPGAVAARIEYKLAAGATCADTTGFTQITTSTSNAFALTLSSNFADGDVTTKQLSGAQTFVAGNIYESTNPAASFTLPDAQITEHEWDMQATSNAADGTAYLFRATNNGTKYATYTVCAQATTASVGAPTLSQSAYKWFSNSDSTDVGRGAIMNQPMTAPPQGTPFRLRLLLNVGTATLAQSATTSLLQFSERSGSCDTGFSGESYANMSSTTGAIRYYNNASATDGANLTANYEDPRFASSTSTGVGYDTVRNQVYSEGSNNFSNSVAAIAAGEDGLWDFALVDNSAPPNTSYCFRAVQAGGGVLSSYGVIPEIQTYQPMKIKLRGNVKLRQVLLH